MWIRTTDLARLDRDGFLWVVGGPTRRSCAAASRSSPTWCAPRCERHPAVRGAAVVGIDDERLGQVPVAAVELREGCTTSASDLLEHARVHLAAYELPVEIFVVDTLPRTPSAKVELPAVRALFTDAQRTAEV